MHIALADSNVGDRKQMERLLGRESDKRASTKGILYIETFGNSNALLECPIVYDIYFLDVTDKECNSYDIAKKLRDKGIMSPIVFCISSIDYHMSGELLPNTVFINKPIKTDELALVIDSIQEQKEKDNIPLIEFRNNRDTFYLEESQIVYIQGEDYSTNIFLTDGSCKVASGFVDSVWNDVCKYECFFVANYKTIVNAKYVEGIEGLNLIMKNNSRVKYPFKYKKKIIERINMFKKES